MVVVRLASSARALTLLARLAPRGEGERQWRGNEARPRRPEGALLRLAVPLGWNGARRRRPRLSARRGAYRANEGDAMTPSERNALVAAVVGLVFELAILAAYWLDI